MPKFEIELDDGRQFEIEADKQPSPEEVISFINQGQQSGPATQATPDQFLSAGERFATGFEFDPLEAVAQKRAERGLAPGTPLEPTGFNIENLKDFPSDILDAIGPAFPAVFQLLGGLSGAAVGAASGGVIAPLTIAKGGVAGAAGGEVLRQFIGSQILDHDEATVGQRLGKVAVEGALATVGEGAAIGVNLAIRQTKTGILKAANNLLKKGSLDKFTEIFGSITRGFDELKTRFSLRALRNKDERILSKKFANPGFLDDFTDDLLYSKDLTKNIQGLATAKPGAREPIKSLFKEYLKLTDDVLDTVIDQGPKLNKFKNENVILKLGDDIKNVVAGKGTKPGLLDSIGKRLGTARINLAKEAGGAPVDLTDVNNIIIPKLTNSGLLKPVLGEEKKILGFQINESFAVTQTGKAQMKLFGPLINRLFKKETIKAADVIEKAMKEGLKGPELAKLLETTKTKTFFSPRNTVKYRTFAKKLANLDVQISGNEFKNIGQLSPELTKYLAALRNIPREIAEKHGDESLIALTDEFSNVAEIFKPLRKAISVNDREGVEAFMRSISNKNVLLSRLRSARQIDDLLKTKGVDLFGTLDKFQAANAIKGLEDPIVRAKSRQPLINLMKGSFQQEESAVLSAIKEGIDPFLAKGKGIFDNATTHVVARDLHASAVSLLKARFLQNALITPTAGAAVGGIVGGREAATLGLVGGFALQNPAVLRILLKVAAKQQGKTLKGLPTKKIPREAIVSGIQLIKSLVQSQGQ